MSATEFELIRRYFNAECSRDDVALGIGDDCALLVPPLGKQLAITVDTLVSGVHFPLDTRPEDIAYKAIAVNISDLAAMGATPAWLTLALSLPEANESWLQAFAESFHSTAKNFGANLIGGDTTCGPLSITVQATGFVDESRALRRDAARPGDVIYVSGTLGDAALGLRMLQADLLDGENRADVEYLLERLNRPVPRVEFAQAVSACARCAIDISDGLLSDLGHILRASSCSARLYLEAIPLSQALQSVYNNNAEAIDMQNVLSGGDDYELCFTLDPANENLVLQCAREHNLLVTRVGVVTETPAGSPVIECVDATGKLFDFSASGYQHF